MSLKRLLWAGAVITVLFVLVFRVTFPFDRISSQYPHCIGANSKLPNVLLIGDSIEIRYYPFVKAALAGKANVYRIVELAPQHPHSLIFGGPLVQPVNGATTDRGRRRLKDWLGHRHWDVIHFNWGLHNLVKNGTPLSEGKALRHYRDDLGVLFRELEKTHAQLVFATTTPVPAGSGYPPGMVVAMNRIAKEIAKRDGVRVDDLYASILPHEAVMQYRNDLHFNNAGSKLMAAHVASSILLALRDEKAMDSREPSVTH